MRLQIPFDTRVANSLIREESGVALRILYAIKQTMTQIKNDLKVRTHTNNTLDHPTQAQSLHYDIVNAGNGEVSQDGSHNG
jgi:hypothetical protein